MLMLVIVHVMLMFIFFSILSSLLPGAAAAGASSLSQVCRVSPLPTTRAGRPLWSPCGWKEKFERLQLASAVWTFFDLGDGGHQ